MQKNLEGKEIPITQSKTRLVNIGQVTIKKDGSITTELIGPDQVTSIDQKINKLIVDIESSYQDELNEKKLVKLILILIISDKDGNRLIRKYETNLANIVSDALLDEAKSHGGADFSMVNGGSIRTNIKAGTITYVDVINVLPFTNGVSIVKLKGQVILDALEMSARKFPDENGGFLHTSGLTYRIDPNVKTSVEVDERNFFVSVNGDRRVKDVLINGNPIDPNKVYRVIGDSYILLENSDGYVFNDLEEVTIDFDLPYEVFIRYIKKISKEDFEKYREPQGRIEYITSTNNEGTPTKETSSTTATTTTTTSTSKSNYP